MEMKRIALILILEAMYCTDVSSNDCTFVHSCSKTFTSKPGVYHGKLEFVAVEYIKNLEVEIILNKQASSIWSELGQFPENARGDKFKIEDTRVKINSGEKYSIEFYINYNETLPNVEDVKVNGRSICLSSYPPSKNFFSPNNVCGKVDFRVMANPLIIVGTSTKKGQWPWHVAIYYAQYANTNYRCGGTLVSASHVITVAHCVISSTTGEPVNHETLTVYLGKHNLGTTPDSVQVMIVKQVILHPQFNYTNLYADLALLKFNRPSEYTRYVRPICLWKDSETSLDDIIYKEGTVVGWGIDKDGKLVQELMSVKMPVVRQDTCIYSSKKFYTHFTSERSYCAGYRNGSSVCNGDSGGGMVFGDKLDGETIWRLRGIVSLSKSRENDNICDPFNYVIFTDVAQFSQWINENIS